MSREELKDAVVEAAKTYIASYGRGVDGFTGERLYLALREAVRALDAAPEKPAELTEAQQVKIDALDLRIQKIEQKFSVDALKRVLDGRVELRLSALESRLAKEPEKDPRQPGEPPFIYCGWAGCGWAGTVKGLSAHVAAIHGSSATSAGPAPPPSDPSGAGMTLEERFARSSRKAGPFIEKEWAAMSLGEFLREAREIARAARVEALAEFAKRREDYHMTFNGGHHEEPAYGAFHHGMDTVFNGLDGAVKGERDQSIPFGRSKLRSSLEAAKKGEAT